MKYLLFSFLLLLTTLNAQEIDLRTFNPDDVLVAGDQLPKILLVGTFHMSYPNLDAHVTKKEDQVDVNDKKRRAEMRELLDYLARFRPTKIAIERWPNSNENEEYSKYLAGELELSRNEIHQIGYRLGKQFGHKELVLSDAGTLIRTLYNDPRNEDMIPMLDSIYAGWDFSSPHNKIAKRYRKLYKMEDQAMAGNTLLDIFKYENDPYRIRRGHGAYLVGDFELGESRGADALAMHWYARNLRIYRNIQRSVTSPEDRILVLYGAGHLGILRQQFESSPEFELVDFNDLEKMR